ncbi:hypothetical protein M3Y98_00519600 [Aphelenchoides besseyi]|nr:hypothetical protein M3Y98_00519600 [Aphelenchoides besseyi]KAI6207933.1 hypothetical protein M3Y96_00061200 [Aphelenchoides besseyi]
MDKRCNSGDCGTSQPNPAERCLNGWLHLRTGMKLIVAIGTLVIAALIVLLAIYFRKAMFLLIISSVVTVFAAGALFRHDHRFVWPLIGISFFHMFLTLYMTLIFLFFFLFKPLYIIMVFNWAFDTMYGSKNTSYYIKCACIMIGLIVFFLYNLWQLKVALNYYQHLQLVNEYELPTKVNGSASSSVALNFSQRESPSPPPVKRSVGGTSAVIFVNGINGQQTEPINGVRSSTASDRDSFV